MRPLFASYLISSTLPCRTSVRNCEYSTCAFEGELLGAVCHTSTMITITPMTTHGSHRERGVIGGRAGDGRFGRPGGSGGRHCSSGVGLIETPGGGPLHGTARG